MKRLLLAVTFFVIGLNVFAVELPKTEVIKVNGNLYALLGPPELPNKANRGYMVNSTLIIGDKGVILVDTGFSDEIGRHLNGVIKGITDKPVTHVINTHHHGDHTLGNSEFKGAEIISAEKCKELVEKIGYEWIGMVEGMTGLKFPNTRPVPATRVYPEHSHNAVVLQGVKLDLWVPGGSHTPGDMLVYLPDDKALMGGDILVNTITPNFRDGNVKTWITTLGEITRMDLKTIVPGHGPLMQMQDVHAMRQRMLALYAGVEKGYKQGLMDSDIRKTLDLSAWKRLKHFDANMGTNISRTYLEVEAANF